MDKFYKFTQKPWPKAIISILTPIIIGIISSIFITEITTHDGIKIATSISKISFYILLVLIIITFVYNLLIFKYEKTKPNFETKLNCITYIRSQMLPEIVGESVKKIKNGEINDLEKNMEKFKRMLEL